MFLQKEGNGKQRGQHEGSLAYTVSSCEIEVCFEAALQNLIPEGQLRKE